MINVIGTGYIGLPTALMFAKSGQKVVATDVNTELIESLKRGVISFEENGLKGLFEDALSNGIEFSTEHKKAEIYIIAVPTPYIQQNKRPDYKYLIDAIRRVLDVCEKGVIIIIESTVSPGTINKKIKPMIEGYGYLLNKDVYVAHAPERILPGKMLHELEYNPRTIGADSVETGEKVKSLYESFCKGEITITDIRTAEMSKVVENTYRDINIAYANELAKICREDDMDVYEIIRIANRHPRVNILQPGPGVGGHCISVDPWFLVGDYPDLTNMILTARKTNNSMPSHVLRRIRDIMKDHDLTDISKVGLYGLTYKEDVDDTRESPTLQLLNTMEEHLAFGILSYDPMLKTTIVENQLLDFGEFINKIELLVIMVGHTHIKQNMDLVKNKHILDTRNVCEGNSVYRL